MKIQTQSTRKTPYILAATILVVLLLGAYTGYAYTQRIWPFMPTSQQTQTDTMNADDTTYGSDKNNDRNQPTTPSVESPDESEKTTVQVGVASAAVIGTNVEIRAFMSGIIEGTGTCTATLTNGNEVVTGSSVAFIDASTSQCEPISIALSEFTNSGTWKVNVSYSSETHEGTSDELEIEL